MKWSFLDLVTWMFCIQKQQRQQLWKFNNLFLKSNIESTISFNPVLRAKWKKLNVTYKYMLYKAQYRHVHFANVLVRHTNAASPFNSLCYKSSRFFFCSSLQPDLVCFPVFISFQAAFIVWRRCLLLCVSNFSNNTFLFRNERIKENFVFQKITSLPFCLLFLSIIYYKHWVLHDSFSIFSI